MYTAQCWGPLSRILYSSFIIKVYLQQSTSKIDSFKDQVDILNELIQDCNQHCEVVVIGDSNCQFGNEYRSRFGLNIFYSQNIYIKIYIYSKNDWALE